MFIDEEITDQLKDIRLLLVIIALADIAGPILVIIALAEISHMFFTIIK